MPSLTTRKISSLKKPGMHGDGSGLYLRIGPTGAKSWILRTRINGRFTKGGNPLRWEGGLGSASLVTLAEAREIARELRKVARTGKDPSVGRKEENLTFQDAAQKVFDGLKPTWKSEKHASNWWLSLEKYVFSEIGARPIEGLGTADVLAILSPIWTSRHETARRLKQRIGTIFDWAKGAGHYSHENPVNGLKKALPTVRTKVNHMPALDWQKVPAFISLLKKRPGVSARTLEFIILTAVRSGEARGARWAEISGDIWTVPPERMKRGIEHRVPLSGAAMAVLDKVRGLDDEFVFPSHIRGKYGETRIQSVMVFKALYKRMQVDSITTHGFRSSFRDWASDKARASWDVAEAALSHSVGDETARSYARSDLYEQRQELMNAWAKFITSPMENVVAIEGKK